MAKRNDCEKDRADKIKNSSHMTWIIAAVGAGVFSCLALIVAGIGSRYFSTQQPDKDEKNLEADKPKGFEWMVHTLRPSEPVTIKGIKVELDKCYRDWPDVPRFQARFKITNNTPGEIIYHTPFSVTLVPVKDEFGNAYSVFIPGDPELLLEKRRIDPDQTIEDGIVFSVPQKACNEITLSLRGDNFNRPGHTIICKVPRSSFRLP